MRDEHSGQATGTDGYRIDHKSGQALHQLHDLERRAGSWIEEAAVDRERLRPHRLVVDDLRAFGAQRHHGGVEKAAGIHETSAEGRQGSADPCVLSHDPFVLSTLLRVSAIPVRANVFDAFANLGTARDQDVILDRRHHAETERADHFDFGVEVARFVENGAQSARHQEETDQEGADQREHDRTDLFSRGDAQRDWPDSDWF